ncbi:hypothetical protein ACA910_015259 [Epithemia clementina (nom. ined.)]
MAKVAIVTGANQGLGFALVEALCRQLGNDATVYLTARNVERGQAAVSALVQTTKGELKPVFHQLDVTDQASVTAFANEIRQRHGGVDIVISNAAARISRDQPPSENVSQLIETNNHGTYRMIQAFRDLLNDGARFVVVASSFGSLTKLPEKLHNRFDVETKSLEDIEAVMTDYVHAVQNGTVAQQGWPEWINVASKVGQVASTKIFAREILRQEEQEQDFAAAPSSPLTTNSRKPRRDILINAVCPGLIDTEASRPWFDDMSQAATPAEAAVDVVWLATLPRDCKDAPYGELVRKRKIIPWK